MRSTSIKRRARTAIVILAGIAAAVTVVGQPATPKLEVASIKVHVSNAGFHPQDCSGDRFVVTGMQVTDILRWAYDLQGDAARAFVLRVPDSLRQTGYDFQAKAEGPMTEPQCRLMVQALMADRFKLAFHWEEKEAELVELVVARGGSKIQKALPTDAGTDINIVINGKLLYTEAPIADPAIRATTKGMTMQELAQRLPTSSPQPTADKTGLEGRFKIDLRYSTMLTTADSQDVADPPLDAALAQLGLRLEKRKGSVKVPVLDHIEPPDEN